MHRKLKRVGAAGLALLLGACNAPPGPEDIGDPKAAAGRAETRNIRDLDKVGYGGSGVANQVDALLDANDQRAGTLERQLYDAAPSE